MKKIGIVGWKTGDNSFGATIPYLNYFSKFGQIEILLPSKEIRKDLDLLVLPGGLDVNPTSYGEVPSFHTSNQDVFKQFFFDNNLESYILNGTPIFGICLGFQQLCVHFGSKMTQHMEHPYSDPRNKLVHDVYEVESNTEGEVSHLYYRVLDDKKKPKNIYRTFKVNSIHHQAVSVKNINHSELEVLLIDSSNGKLQIKPQTVFVEAMKHRNLPIAGVQYHPEETNCEYAENLINNLLTCLEKSKNELMSDLK